MDNVKTSTIQPEDFGPVYAETDLARFPVEPWSVFSNLIFLLIVIYWAFRTKLNYRHYPLITIAVPLIFIGFCGGELYHAFRNYRLWLLLDYLPILFLALTGCVYFWQLIYKNIFLTFISSLLPLFLYRIFTIFVLLPDAIYISLGYAALALNVMFPTLLYCILKNRKNCFSLFLGAIFFAVAVLFRQMDFDYGKTIVPVGTHFLWHIFGGISVFFFMRYIYSVENMNIEAPIPKV